MSKTWKQMDLSGNGLQTINLLFTEQKKTIRTALIYTMFFPLGLHQYYLQNYKKVGIYIALSTAALSLQSISPKLSIACIIIEIILLTYDLWKMDDNINQYNKQLKIRLSLQMDATAPESFKGKYTDNVTIEDYIAQPDHPNNSNNSNAKIKSPNVKSRVYSFTEQEELLKSMQKSKKEKNKK